MEIEVLEKKDHALLSRIEVSFKVKHPNESTPKRNEVRAGLAERMDVKNGCIVIDNMKAVFGRSETIGLAKIYKSDENAKAIEHKHILMRNNLISAEREKSKPKKGIK